MPRSKLKTIALAVFGLWLIKILLPEKFIRHPLLSAILNLASLAALILLGYYLVRLFLWLKDRLFWKIRRRLAVSHIFIAVIPILLILATFYLSAYLISYQSGNHTINNQLKNYWEELRSFSLLLRTTIEDKVAQHSEGGEPIPIREADIQQLLEAEAKYIQAIHPQVRVVLQIKERVHKQTLAFFVHPKNKDVEKYKVPDWLKGNDFTGLVLDDERDTQAAGGRADSEHEDRASHLNLRSIVFSDAYDNRPFTLEISIPFDKTFLDKMKSATGIDLVLTSSQYSEATKGRSVTVQRMDAKSASKENLIAATLDNLDELERDLQIFAVILQPPIRWSTGQPQMSSPQVDSLGMAISSFKFYQGLFSTRSQVEQNLLRILIIIIGIFFLVELVSVVIGVVLTGSITGAVNSLYRGTQLIKEGKLDHRIIVESRDQLGALADSFNQMAASIQGLLSERVERERLERELEIAKEVQTKLFPKQAPKTSHMEVFGVCLPARSVSGDYYDFFSLSPSQLGIAVADVCGKGIYAALLMSNLQAMLHSHINHFRSPGGADFSHDGTVVSMVSSLNRQIYNYTAPDKFASFFYGVHDAGQRLFTYCNAGHNAPILLTGHQAKRLDVGGIVLGIVPSAEYQQKTIELNPGDLLVIYTDGITEPINEYGEEFGDARLIELITKHRNQPAQRIHKAIIDAITEWSYEQEQADDMTLIVAKVT